MSEHLSVLIADDERPARAKIRQFVETDPEVHAIYEAADGSRALDVIRDAAPDVIFLDIQMPGATGIEVAQALPSDGMGKIVFVTAYDEYAVHAFDLHAVDYLLKPFNRPRFDRAWQRVRSAISAEDHALRIEQLRDVITQLGARSDRRLRRVLVPQGEGSRMVDLNTVSRIDAAKNYLTIVTPTGRHRLRGTISDLEARLDPGQFARVNRSTIVNLSHIAGLQSAGHGDQDITLRDGSVVRLSRRFRDRLDSG